MTRKKSKERYAIYRLNTFLKWLEKEFRYYKPEIAEIKKQLERIGEPNC